MNTTMVTNATAGVGMNPLYIPPWAEVFGEDRYGVFAEFRLNGVTFAWRWIPPGSFLMGSPATEIGRDDNEGPQHRVTISEGFWLGETPVTQSQWTSLKSENPSRFQGHNQRPVEQVTWYQCFKFADELNQHVSGLTALLPAEAQWEYACRAGTQGAFHIQNSICTQLEGFDPALDALGWFNQNSQETKPVKGKRPNMWGLYDMHGNVWEWCRDGKRQYESETQLDPVGPMEECTIRVIRGGSWWNEARLCRSACRYHHHPGHSWDRYGFRLFASQEPVLGAERPVAKRRSHG